MGKYSRRQFIKTVGLGSAALMLANCTKIKDNINKPNIVYILADDMGYGDVQAFNENCKIPTPHLNKLAQNGMIFTDAHSGSAVCTPTRYGVLTGRYNWRSRLKAGVLAGYSPHLIEEGRLTVSSFLKSQGYSTGCVGKWHLGWDWATKDDYEYTDAWGETGEHVDYSKPITNGPRAVGFDYNFCIQALCRAPYVYLENNKVVESPTEIIKRQGGYGFYRKGPIAENFDHKEVLPKFTSKSVDFIKRKSDQNKPFFLYFPLSAPHTPILPTEKFKGKSGLGPYGDFVMQCDWTVGKIVETLKQQKIYNNTLIIFTSDNGCSPMANFKHLEQNGHDPGYHFRGHKADIFEGGQRIPFIACWPEKIEPNSVCNDVTCLTDLMATTADMLGEELPDNAGEDSVSMLPNLLGKAEKPLREATVHHSINGSFSIRKGKWKLEFCPGSGGWSSPTPAQAKNQALSKIQLYDLSKDIGETNNIADQYPKIVYELTKIMEKYVKQGRSTPGKPQENNGKVDFWKHTLVKKSNKPAKINHKAINKKVEIANSNKNSKILTNGVLGTLKFDDGNWLGFEGNDANIILDLEKQIDISSVKIGFLQDQNAWIFLPENVKIEYSGNDKNYKSLKSISHKIQKNDKPIRKPCGLDNLDLKARYIRITAENIKQCPEWHKGSGGKAWIFCDEIVVR